MLIGKKYKIESDSLNVTLYKRVKSKNKGTSTTTTWRAIGYFSNPQNAMKYLAKLEVMETGMKDIATVIKKQEEIFNLVDNLNGLSERVE